MIDKEQAIINVETKYLFEKTKEVCVEVFDSCIGENK